MWETFHRTTLPSLFQRHLWSFTSAVISFVFVKFCTYAALAQPPGWLAAASNEIVWLVLYGISFYLSWCGYA